MSNRKPAPPKILKRSRFEETKIIHKRCIELTNNDENNIPRVPIHSSIQHKTDTYLIALEELRRNLIPSIATRTHSIVHLNDILPCSNSY